MKYLLAIISDESEKRDPSPEERQASMHAWDSFTTEAIDKGVHIGGEGLQPSETATTLRRHGDDHLITDGPFAETKEQLGGYYLLECKDLDEAIAWAKKLPIAAGGAVEVRPVMDYEAVGSTVHSQSEASA